MRDFYTITLVVGGGWCMVFISIILAFASFICVYAGKRKGNLHIQRKRASGYLEQF